MILLIVSILILIVALAVLYLAYMAAKAERKRTNALLNIFCWKWSETDKQFKAALTPFETLRIKELRLRKSGWDFCVKCGKVSGLHYLHKDGHVAAVVLKSFKVWKDNKPVRISKCLECIERGA